MRETLDLLRRYYDAFNAGDTATFLNLLTDDVAHDVNEGQREIGREAFARFMDRMNASYRERITNLAFMSSEDGSRGGTEYVVEGTYLETDAGLPEANGQTYRLPGGAFFEIREGKIARVTNYYNLPEWIRQVTVGSESA